MVDAAEQKVYDLPDKPGVWFRKGQIFVVVFGKSKLAYLMGGALFFEHVDEAPFFHKPYSLDSLRSEGWQPSGEDLCDLLPDSFYSDRTTRFRCEMLVGQWRRLHEVSKDLEARAEQAEQRVKQQAEDWAADHTRVQKLCLAAGVSKEQVEGDSHGVPGISDLADMLGERMKLSAEEHHPTSFPLHQYNMRGNCGCETCTRTRLSSLHEQLTTSQAEVARLTNLIQQMYWTAGTIEGGNELEAVKRLKAENERLRTTLQLVLHWDCLHPTPRVDLLGDLGWPKEICEAALKPKPASEEPAQ